MQGYVHSTESFGTVDGPGIRFVVFMQGCPLRCKYCHNPETWAVGKGQLVDAEEIFRQAMKYESYFKNGGGVTLSGGEPLLQIDFCISLLKMFKKAGIHTAVDTCGFMFDPNKKEMVKKHLQLLKYTDLFLLDIKEISPQKHKDLTGVSNDNTLAFAKFLSEHDKAMWVRYVLVPNITSQEEDLKGLRQFLDTLKSVEKVEVLPYHTLGVPKYEQLGIDYPLKNVQSPTKKQVEIARQILGVGHGEENKD